MKRGRLGLRQQHLNTLDLDFCGIDQLSEIVAKIMLRKCHGPVAVSDSNKGYHVAMYCEKRCDDCRLVFDDQERYARDRRRPWWSRNVLFDRKIFISRQCK